MKPCSIKHKEIALLATNSLKPPRESELRAHLATCAGCRGYLEEITNVTKAIAVSLPKAEGEPSNLFHANLMNAVKQSESAEKRRGIELDWIQRWALSAAAAAILMTAAWMVIRPHGQVALSAPIAKLDLTPTFANYETAVSRDKLDELLKEQENRNSERLPIYTAGLPNANLTD